MGYFSMVILPLQSASALEVLEGLRRGIINSKLGAMSSVATVIAALLCGAVFLKISHDYLSGRGITLWEIVRPLVLLMLCSNFNTFVAGPLHATCNLMTKSMSRTVNVSGRQVMSLVGASIKRQFENSQMKDAQNWAETDDKIVGLFTQKPEEKPSFWKKIGNGIGNLFMAGVHALSGVAKSAMIALDFVGSTAIMGLLESILYWLMRLVMFGQQVYCYIYLSLLTLLGPFAFALGVYPGFSHSVTNWLSRYIQICFWIPIGQLVMYCNYWVLQRLSGLGVGAMFGDKWIMIVALIVCILNITAVPQIANFVVDSAGDSGAMGTAKSTLRETFQTVGSLKALLGGKK